MDSEPRANETRDPEERALSSEPCTTRPKPFDDEDASSRKRRRTSQSGSPTHSTYTVATDTSSSNTHEAENMARDPQMKVDTDPTSPQTPERQTASADHPTEPPSSSKVTINLRSSTVADTPDSPTMPPHLVPLAAASDDVRPSVEMSEASAPRTPQQGANTPISLASDDDSAEVEAIPSQDNMSLDAFEGAGPAYLHDPCLSFPFSEPGETLTDTVGKIATHLAGAPTDGRVLQNLARWFASYVTWCRSTSWERQYASMASNRQFWLAVPDLIWTVSTRFTSTKDISARPFLREFYNAFARATGCLVLLDYHTLYPGASHRRFDELPYVELMSHVFLSSVQNLIHKEYSHTDGWGTSKDVAALLECLVNQASGLATFHKMVELYRVAISRVPRFIDQLPPICQTVSDIMSETQRRIDQYDQVMAPSSLRDEMATGLQVFQQGSASLEFVIEKHTSQLASDTASALIMSLTDVYRLGLVSHDATAIALAKAHQQKHPRLPQKYIADTIAWEWRFGILERLIRTGQMQLKITAVTQMCGDLVNLWKRYGENPADGPYEAPEQAYLTFFAEYLLRTKLVEFVLGPTCHPEITVESANIVGFLVVTKHYKKEQTDLLWQTMTSSQDPHVCDALTRMVGQIAGLMHYDELVYLCEKMKSVSAKTFSGPLMKFAEHIFKGLGGKVPRPHSVHPYEICLRLLQESLLPSQSSPVAHPEVYHWAVARVRDTTMQYHDDAARREICAQCIDDISKKTKTTLGSLVCLNSILRPSAADFRAAVAEKDLTRLLVEELEHAIEAGRASGFPAVLDGDHNAARKDLIGLVILQEAKSITADLGLKLWTMIVGNRSPCPQDRLAGWEIINNTSRRYVHGCMGNPFLSTCFVSYLSSVPPQYFCKGSLEFIRGVVVPRFNEVDGDSNLVSLDNEKIVEDNGIEELWRHILEGPDQAIVDASIKTLVKDVYIDSATIKSYPPNRAREVHLGLANRCLRQLGAAASKLKAYGEGTTSGDDEPMVIVASDCQEQEQQRLFIRSLTLLRRFLEAHQEQSQFATPDLRPLMQWSSNAVEGESAELKYQSFDGDRNTGVLPLTIGRRNTAASLLASLKEATGFENYRVYYRGHPFAPKEHEICKSLEDLQVHDGLILVKKELGGTSPSVRIKPGASPLEIEILSHFQELWEYLSMDERLSQETYDFLIRLPAHDLVLEKFESESVSYKELFPLGQSYKCLYAIHALREHTQSMQRMSGLESSATQLNGNAEPFGKVLGRAISLVVDAISDAEIIERAQTPHLRSLLGLSLAELLAELLDLPEASLCGGNDVDAVAAPPLSSLLAIVSNAEKSSEEVRNRTVIAAYTVMLQLCFLSRSFWTEFRNSEAVEALVGDLMLRDSRPTIRKFAVKLTAEKLLVIEQAEDPASPSRPGTVVRRPAAPLIEVLHFFWDIILRLLPEACTRKGHAFDVLQFSHDLVFKLVGKEKSSFDLVKPARMCCDLILNHVTTEHITQMEPRDCVIDGLVRLLHLAVNIDPRIAHDPALPPNAALKIFRKQLFPPLSSGDGPVAPCVLNTSTRKQLYETILFLSSGNPLQFRALVQDLNDLVRCAPDDSEDEPYQYELRWDFDRSKYIRSPCGYVGLRNLSNTCYLNSLLTQLFMNTGFRDFMLSISVQDPPSKQRLLVATQNLFSSMQESYRRFIDPEVFVSSIRTYDDTPIDIHNQMDVDEFYNLLFDRWESQLPFTADRNSLRSFYGGQLVQQVKSKECEHVSERLDTFQAIQCDIKGKENLQASLQAYVEGEVMEGDNRYKCGQCNQFVDAVKRSCIKTMPDSLIFHLKRFDFNLRSLQRNKINEHFAFPTRINMTPYTIEYLENPEGEFSEDTFELVGILVHSGTAESGHYYSYIRERPTADGEESWFEFNDDSVLPWDHHVMESFTFGGPEFRSNFEANGIVYEKPYSAYMLFYQRSSSLRAQEEHCRLEGIPMPPRADPPADIMEHIRSENSRILRRHCLYDPCHPEFVLKVLRQLKNWRPGNCSDDHEQENLAMRLALGHYDQVIARTRDLPDFASFAKIINLAISECARCSLALYRYYDVRHESLRALLQKAPEQMVRQEQSRLLLTALAQIKHEFPHLYQLQIPEGGGLTRDYRGVVLQLDLDNEAQNFVVKGAVRMFDTMWRWFYYHPRYWHEYFYTMYSFANMGKQECVMLLSADFLVRVMRIIVADQVASDPTVHLAEYPRLIANIQRKMPTRTPSYEAIIRLILHLMKELSPTITVSTIADSAEDRLYDYLRRGGGPMLWTSAEISLLHQDWKDWQRGGMTGSIFVDRLITLDQASQTVDGIVKLIAESSQFLESKVFNTLRSGISGLANHNVSPSYLRVAAVFCSACRDELVSHVVDHVVHQCQMLQNLDGRSFLDFFRSLAEADMIPLTPRRELVRHLAVESIPHWAPSLLGYYVPAVRASTEELLQTILFQRHAAARQDDDEAGEESARKVIRVLAMECLRFLQEQFISDGQQVKKEAIAPLQRVVAKCSEHFDPEVEAGTIDATFFELRHGELTAGSAWEAAGAAVMGDGSSDGMAATQEALTRSAVDELDDEGSGMSSSQHSDSDTVTLDGASDVLADL